MHVCSVTQEIRTRGGENGRCKDQIVQQRNKDEMAADFSSEAVQSRRRWRSIFKIQKKKNFQPTVLQPTESLSKVKAKYKDFFTPSKTEGISQ